MENTITRGVSFIVSMILARLLVPDEYGKVAIISMFLGVFTILIDGGFGAALIQKKEVDMTDYSTVLFVSFGVSALLYLFLFFGSPLAAWFYKIDELKPAMRVMGLVVFPTAIKCVENAYLSRRMEFKKFFFATLGGTLASAAVGIYMAVNGFGLWALVFQTLTNELIDTVILTIVVGWDLHLKFSVERVKPLFFYGSKLMLSSLIASVYSYLRGFMIGKVYTTEDLAYYERGEKVPRLLSDCIDAAMGSVLFSAFSKYQDSIELLKKGAKRAVRLSAFMMAPVIFGVLGIAKEGIIVLFSNKWIGAIPYMYIFAISYLFMPVNSTNLRIVLAKGESDLYFRMTIYKMLSGLFVIIFFLKRGVLLFAMSSLISTVISTYINSSNSKRLADYGILEQVRDIAPYYGRALLMFLCIKLVDLLEWSELPTMIIKIMLGVFVYVVLSVVRKEENLYYSIGLAKSYLKKG